MSDLTASSIIAGAPFLLLAVCKVLDWRAAYKRERTRKESA